MSLLIIDLVSFDTPLKSMQEIKARVKAAPNSPFGVILFAFPKAHSKGKRIKCGKSGQGTIS